MAVLAVLSLPHLNSILQRYHLGAGNRALLQLVQNARALALHQHADVILCGSAHASSCDGEWSNQQLIKVSSKNLVRRFKIVTAGMSLEWQGSFGRDQQLEFNAAGWPKAQGSFYLCSKELNFCYKDVINFQGRVRTERVSVLG